MIIKVFFATCLMAFAGGSTSIAQTHPPNVPASDTVQVKSVKELFTKGEVEGHVRNYFMATLNHRELSDNYANAIGARIGFRTAPLHGFRFGFAGLFTYNAFSSDLAERDAIAGKYPQQELELFDVQDPENHADLDRLDELYLEYSSGKVLARVGRISFTSPLINPQDTRMKPYAAQGAHLQLPLHEKSMLTLAWLGQFSPRSTVKWFSAAESIGIYAVGVDDRGQASGYAQHTHTEGVAIAGLQANPTDKLQAEVWNYWIDNVSDNLYARAVLEVAPQVKAGMEGLYQFRVGNGGNKAAELAYFPDQRQWLVGGRLAYEPATWHVSVNYLHTGDGGRFLFPREWGREQFFATLPRGRMEGSGKSDLVNIKVRKQWSKNLSLEGAVAKAWLPAPNAFRFNKYKNPSYYSFVTDLQYKPSKPVLDGLSFRLLYVNKLSPGSSLPLADMYYKTNFHNLNFVTQLTF
ncbi:porin [Pontibacter sp. CAU 1760]